MQHSVIVNNEYTPLQIFFLHAFFPPHSSVFWISMSWACKPGSVVFSRTCLVFQLPADSSLSNPPWPIYKLHVQATRSLSEVDSSLCISNAWCFGWFFAAALVMMNNNYGKITASEKLAPLLLSVSFNIPHMCQILLFSQASGYIHINKHVHADVLNRNYWKAHECWAVSYADASNCIFSLLKEMYQSVINIRNNVKDYSGKRSDYGNEAPVPQNLYSKFKNKPGSLKITNFLFFSSFFALVEGENISLVLFVFHDPSPCLSTE